jgi:hypothetical protein
MSWRVLLIGVFLNLASVLGADERLTIVVVPSVAIAPATVRVRATIQPDADNRTLEVVAESTDFYSSSQLPLDGDRAPRVKAFEFRSLPSGDLRVTVALVSVTGRRTVVTRLVTIGSESAAREQSERASRRRAR